MPKGNNMITKYINMLAVFLLISSVIGCKEEQATSSVANVNNYHLSVTGTSGIELDMICVYKPTGNQGSIEKIQKRISIPYNETISANKYYVWFETLPKGANGNEGDKYFIELKRDDYYSWSCGPSEIKKANTKTCGLGDL